MSEESMNSVLQRAFSAQPSIFGLLVHLDRGEEYCGKVYCKLLHDHKALRSQSRRGDCYDNAQAESLWSRLKTEVLEVRERSVFADLADAQRSVADYLTTTITSACTPASTTRPPITLINSFFKLLP